MKRTACRILVLAGTVLGTGPVRADYPVVPAAPTAAAPVYPNLLIEVGADFLNSLAHRTDSKSDTINTNKEKIRTVGTQVTNIAVGVQTVPSAGYGHIDLVLTGVTNAHTDSQRGRVSLGNDVRISYCSRKAIIFDENGIRELPARTQPHLDMNHLRYLNADFRFPIRPLVKRIAYRAYNKQKPQLNAGIVKDAGQQLSKQFNEETDKQIKQINERYVKDFRAPMVERGVFPQRLRILTSEHQLGLRALLNDPTGKPAAFSAVPDVLGWPDLAVRVEESMPNNFAHVIFAGKTFTGEELDDEFNRLIGPFIGAVKTIESGDKPFTITFAKERPIEVRFYDQKFKITIRGEEYTSGTNDFDAMDTTAIYKLRKTDTGLVAEREGDLVVYPPGFRPGVDRLGALDKSLQQLLDRKFAKVFKPVFEMKEFKLPEAVASKDVFVTTQIASDNGWLTLGWRRAPTQTPAVANQR